MEGNLESWQDLYCTCFNMTNALRTNFILPLFRKIRSYLSTTFYDLCLWLFKTLWHDDFLGLGLGRKWSDQVPSNLFDCLVGLMSTTVARVKWASSKESHVIAVKSAELVLCPEFSAEFEQLNSTSCPPFSFLDCSVHLKIKLHLNEFLYKSLLPFLLNS